MGVGKTTTGQCLKKRLMNSVFLDGDWCWDMNPFQVTLESKKMVIENISFLLDNFIKCSLYENVIFCWVLDEKTIIDDILKRIDTRNCQIYLVSLICDEISLRERLEKDVKIGMRSEDIIDKSIKRLHKYNLLETRKIDVSNIMPAEAAEIILTSK